MEVQFSILYGHIPVETVSENLVGFVEQRIKDKADFYIKSVLKGADPVKGVQNGTLGYYPHYGIAYLANPEKPIGNTGIDPENKRLIFNSGEGAFYDQRDSFVFGYQQFFVVRGGFEAVLKDFEQSDYSFYRFAPRNRGDTIARYTSVRELPFSDRLRLNDLL